VRSRRAKLNFGKTKIEGGRKERNESMKSIATRRKLDTKSSGDLFVPEVLLAEGLVSDPVLLLVL